MTTQNTHVSGAGCSTIVAGMIAILAFLMGVGLGFGGLFVWLSASGENVAALGLAGPSQLDATQEDCPPAALDPGAAPKGYALVYPIEETLRVEGELEPSTLRNYFIKERTLFQKCYQGVLATAPGVAGEMSVQFTVSKSGKVIASVVRENKTGSSELEGCLVDRIKAWTFEDKVASELAVVKIDVLFTPLGL
ncbi:MAG: AgmX/PglI C-terminal domain-containing protein [Myxococcota bacterium]